MECRIGTEHEKLGFQLADHRRLTYDQIRQILEALCKRYHWKPMTEQGMLIGAEWDGQTVTLEPGGQFELSNGGLPEAAAGVRPAVRSRSCVRHLHLCRRELLPLCVVRCNQVFVKLAQCAGC